MPGKKPKIITTPRAFMSALARDVRGNTLAIMAAAVIPLAGMVGGGIDISRMYITKTRLQHACDAAALAGRKSMGGGAWGTDDSAVAAQFFTANFQSGAYGSGPVTTGFTENNGKVSGTASTTLPMTLMKIFGKTTETLSVTCDAEMRMPNTDVMFVLDNTGSMAATPSGDSQSKMASLQQAVKCFYEIVARLPTNATCTTPKPSGGTSSQLQIRFGFVPYDTNVNVGKLLPSNWFADSWTYQSREQSFIYGVFNSWSGLTTANAGNYGAWTNYGTPITATSSNNCKNNLSIPNDQYSAPLGSTASGGTNESSNPPQFDAYAGTTQTNYQRVYNSTTNVCQLQVHTRSIERLATYDKVSAGTAGAVSVPAWKYKPETVNISGLKSGNGWSTTGITLPIGDNFTNKPVTWDGCIEERHTVRQASYDPIPADAEDLDIDSIPTSGDATSLWGPALNDVVYPRRSDYRNSSNYSLNEITTFTNYTGMNYSCLQEARKLQDWGTTATAFDSYVDSMHPASNTYHDIGLLWGARLMSPTGLFRTENALTPTGGPIQRHMIFMTDGDPCTNVSNYQAYGIAWFDRRQTDPTVAPTDGCTTTGTLTQQVNARTVALCAAIQNKNITLWVITFGAVDPNTVTRLTACASSGHYFSASNAAELQSTFATIANQITQLRLTS